MKTQSQEASRAREAPGASPAGSIGTGSGGAVAGVCIFLGILTWAVFGQTLGFKFLNFDDDIYVTDNPMVKAGLTMKGLAWAFKSSHAANWHPLTTLSHMLDCQLYGLNPMGHHLTSVLIHGATAILLFLGLRRMTGVLWPSAFAAAVFAVHPFRAESVAWVAERKDVLSGLFFVLTLWAYARYAAQSKVQSPKSKVTYCLALAMFALGLLSKPMLVTVPLVLLLVDYWPLKRFEAGGPGFEFPRRLILEKLPFLALSLGVCVVTLVVQRHAMRTTTVFPLSSRVVNAAVSCATYLGQMVWPAKLAAYYPYPSNGWPIGLVLLAVAVLAGISAVAFVARRQRPYLLAGWLWYLVMLVPVIGLVQVGAQAHADRYTYLPQIGNYLAIAWAALELGIAWPEQRWLLRGAGAAVVVVLAVCAHGQTSIWRDSESLWTHTLARTTDNSFAEGNLGVTYLHDGRVDEAIEHCRRALALGSDSRYDHNALGFALLQKGEINEAILELERALKGHPEFADAQNNLGLAYFQAGRIDEAIPRYEKALELEPDIPDTHSNLGAALVQKGRLEEAVAQYEWALQLRPEFAGAANNLAWVLATCTKDPVRNGRRAVELAERANQLSGGKNMVILRTLSAAYAEAGRFPEAVAAAEQALQLATAEANYPWIGALREALSAYQAGKPLRYATQEKD